MSELSGKVALVTGASRGIGLATAKELAKRGVSTVLAARSEAVIQKVAEEIIGEGGRAWPGLRKVVRFD